MVGAEIGLFVVDEFKDVGTRVGDLDTFSDVVGAIVVVIVEGEKDGLVKAPEGI